MIEKFSKVDSPPRYKFLVAQMRHEMQLNMASHYEFKDYHFIEQCSLFQPKLLDALCPAFQFLQDSNKLQKQIQEIKNPKQRLQSVMSDIYES